MPYKPQTEAEFKQSKPEQEPADVSRSRRLAAHWKQELNEVDDNKKNKAWQKRSIDIINRFRDDRDKATEEGQRRLNTLWGWYETIKPACYGRVPVASVERRFLDKDPVGKTSAQILERCLINEMSVNGFDRAMKRAVQDYLLIGRGQAWVRYEPVFEESASLPPTSYTDEEDSQGQIEPEEQTESEEKLEDTGSTVEAESAPLDYIPWPDFRMYPARARTWKEVQAVSKDIWLSKEECVKAFGEEVGHALQAEPVEPDRNQRNDFASTLEDKVDDKRRITEIWDKKTKRVYWINHGYPFLCKEEDDPLQLTGFFPCPEPLCSITTNDTLIPVAYYHEFQDQALQIDELTQRINMLTKSLKVAGVYAADNRALARLLDENTENALIPVDNWAALGDKGLEGAVYFMPIKEVAEVLTQLIEARKVVMEDLDLITGISDVMRGTSDARETMGGQRLKANAAGTRIEDMRKEVGRFATDIANIMAEVICKNFQPKTLIEASGIFYEQDIPNEMGLAAFEMLDLMPMLGPTMGLPGMGLPALPSPSLAPPQSPPLPPPSPTGGPVAPQGLPAPQPAPAAPGLPVPALRPPGAMPQPSLPAQPPMPSPMAGMMPVLKAAQDVKKAIDLLRKDAARGYRITVDVDTMVAGDHEAERQDAVEFLQAATGFIEKTFQMAVADPDFAPLAGAMLEFGVRKFRVGRDLEATLNTYVEAKTKKAQEAAQNPQQKPNPEQVKAQTEQAKAQAEITKAKIDAQSAQANDQREQQLNQQDLQIKMAEMQMRMKEMQMEMQRLQAEHQLKMQELAITHGQKMQQHAMHQQQQVNQAFQPPVPPLQ